MPKDQIYISAAVVDEKAQWTDMQRDIMAKAIAALDGSRVRIWIEEEKRNRTLNQNSYYWGVVLTYISDHTGYTTNELHDFFRGEYLQPVTVEVAGKKKEVLKSTTDLDTHEMTNYIQCIIIFAAQELGVNIPPASEVRQTET